jgi:hypothetical protein
VCTSLAPRGDQSNTDAFMLCEEITDASLGRSACQDGLCVASNVGQIGDRCGADAPGITCRKPDECGEDGLECRLTSGDSPGNPKESGDQERCVKADIAPGELCPQSKGGARLLAFCEDGASCEFVAGSDFPKCVFNVPDGGQCKFDDYRRCSYDSSCVAGICKPNSSS